jgi:hypothetical protein
VAFELRSRLFFLPVHSMRHDKTGALELAETVSSAIVGYRQKHPAGPPFPVDGFEFGAEQKLPSDSLEHLKQTSLRQPELPARKNYQAVPSG